MSIIESTFTRATQPESFIEGIGNPIIPNALLSAVIPGLTSDLVSKKLLTIGSGGSLAPDQLGVSLRGSGSANVGSIPIDLSKYSAITVTGIIKVDSWKTTAGQYEILWELTPEWTLNNGAITFHNGGTEGLTIAARGSSNEERNFGSANRPSTGVYHTYTVIYDFTQSTVATELRLFIDGVEKSQTASNGVAQSDTATFANSTLNLLNRNAASLPTTGNMAGLFIHAGALSTNDIASIAQNPWRILADEQQQIWFDAASSGVSGTSSTTNANDSSSAAGTTTVTGSSATTNLNDTSTASGTTTVAGSSATTNADDTSAASGSVGNDISGTIATTNANDASSASGTTTIIGGIAANNGNDASSSTGTTTVTGTAATTNVDDTSTASGIAGAVTGTIAYTNENDTSSGSGTAGDSITSIGGDDAPHGIYYQDQKRKSVTRRPLDKLMDEAVSEYYKEIKQTAPKAVQRKAAKIVKPYAEDKLKIPEKVDWEDLSHDIARVRQLINLYAKEVAEKQRLEWINQDDENVLMLAHEHDKAVIVEYLNQFYN